MGHDVIHQHGPDHVVNNQTRGGVTMLKSTIAMLKSTITMFKSTMTMLKSTITMLKSTITAMTDTHMTQSIQWTQIFMIMMDVHY